MSVPVFVLGILLLFGVAVFALQNPDAVTLRFLSWQVESSVAILTFGAAATGAVIAALLALGGRLRRWQRGRGPGVPGGAQAAAGRPSW
jgi:uncharacterized integral membrane protein